MTPATTQADHRDHAGLIRATRHRLVILGENGSEVVCAAGGLIYDWSSGGWDVVVHLAVPSDDRPLQILGARAEPLTCVDNFLSGARWPDAIIASPLVYRQNISVRDYFTRALLRGHAAIAMFGDDWPAGLGTDIGRVTYQLGPAARAFKLQAMLAIEPAPTPPLSAEVLHAPSQRFASHPVVSLAPA